MFSYPTIRSLLERSALMLLILPVWVRAQDSSKDVPTRDQIPERYKWDLTTIYPDTKAWEADYARAEGLIEAVGKRKGTLGQSPKELLETLRLRDKALTVVEKLVVYAHQLSDLDTRNSEALGLKDRSSMLDVSMSQAVSWFEPELLTLAAETLRSWCEDEPGLAPYQHYFDDVLRQKGYTLSAREEELMAMAGNVVAAPQNAYTVLNNAELDWTTMTDETGEEVTLSHARFNKFIRSTSRPVRRQAFMAQMEAYARVENTMAALLNGSVQADVYNVRARGFDSCLQAALFPNNLPVSVFTTLVDTVNESLPLQHRWAALRKKTLKLDELHVYDLYQPLVEETTKEIEYDDAVQMVLGSLTIMGDEYRETMKRGFDSRWVDVYETQGKRAGAYSWGAYDTSPFLLLNYNKTLNEVSTIAHEMGHSMHSYFTRKNQPRVYGDYSTFVAEVASTFNEILLEDHLLKSTRDPRERLFLLNHAINQIQQTVFRQTMFAEFELGVHEMAERGQPLTAESLGKLYVDTFHKYWGPLLVRDPEHHSYWARIPHFYRDFYVYQYATSYCAAAALAEGVLAGKPGAIDAYLGFLKAGSSKYPLEILRDAGVDMTSPGPIQATMRRFEQLVTEFEKALAGGEG